MSDPYHKREHREDRTVEYLGTFYMRASHDFQNGIVPVARTIKAETADLAVVELGGGLKTWTK